MMTYSDLDSSDSEDSAGEGSKSGDIRVLVILLFNKGADGEGGNIERFLEGVDGKWEVKPHRDGKGTTEASSVMSLDAFHLFKTWIVRSPEANSLEVQHSWKQLKGRTIQDGFVRASEEHTSLLRKSTKRYSFSAPYRKKSWMQIDSERGNSSDDKSIESEGEEVKPKPVKGAKRRRTSNK